MEEKLLSPLPLPQQTAVAEYKNFKTWAKSQSYTGKSQF
jgi:hypothetical protein